MKKRAHKKEQEETKYNRWLFKHLILMRGDYESV